MDPFLQHRQTFEELLDRFDQNAALELTAQWLANGEMTVPALYEKILAPSLNRIHIPRGEEPCAIWKEHIQTAIVRSVVESAHPYVVRARPAGPAKGKVLLACPEEEYHDLGARMGADFFALAGFDPLFIGSNTPTACILNAAAQVRPALLVLSVTNNLNLPALKKIVQALHIVQPDTRLYLAGSALAHLQESPKDWGASGVIASYADVMALGEVTA